MALGMGVAALLRTAMPDGVEGAAGASMAMDEALAFAALSFEGRSNALHRPRVPGRADRAGRGHAGVDIVGVLRGLRAGRPLHAPPRVAAGVDPHHSWEAASRAFACRAPRLLPAANPFRAGLTVGVKGTLD